MRVRVVPVLSWMVKLGNSGVKTGTEEMISNWGLIVLCMID